MGNRIAAFALLAVSQVGANIGAAGDSVSAVKDGWLMMVTTQNTDPSKDSEFNAWYDTVDIPDVLRVPGYMRARRGREQGARGSARTPQSGGPGRYAALYDIQSRDIDKTIIDMLMASWGMEKSHHSTDLLKVTERIYFHRYSPTYTASNTTPPGADKYIYMERFDCCRGAESVKQFDGWYRDTYVPGVLASAGIVSVTRYRLYRVLMENPVIVPKYLTVYEIRADSAAQALQDIGKAANDPSTRDRLNSAITGRSDSLFLQINDVQRPAAPLQLKVP